MGQTILHVDPWSGISGDMLLAAMLDSGRGDGLLEAALRHAVDALGLDGAEVEIARDVEWGVSCTRVTVRDGGAAPLRHLADMEAIIGRASLSDMVRTRAIGAVRRLAAVEAAVHACPVEEIHFHEVGAVDTLIDVVGVFALAEALGVERVTVGAIPVGGGTVEIAHGRMGVPAPATTLLLEGFDVVGGPEMRELTTPTGALLVGELRATTDVLPAMRPEKVGYGAGAMKLEHGPNLLRVIIGTTSGVGGESDQAGTDRDRVVELETNLDDVSPEVVAHACRALREAEALDVWTVPVYMKKDRPGVVLHALVRFDHEAAATALIFEQTGTLGVRRREVSRHIAARGVLGVTVAGKEVRVKWGRWHDRLISLAPEHDDAVAAADGLQMPLKDVMHLATAAAREQLRGDRVSEASDTPRVDGAHAAGRSAPEESTEK